MKRPCHIGYALPWLLRTALILSFACPGAAAQWSTSTHADSTLPVCPGFYSGILTLSDGSSVIFGALQSYIFARKLDPLGNYLWQSTQVFHHDSSFITETDYGRNWGGWVDDGSGGVILFWYDHRGAYDTGLDWANNAIYAQRLDQNGQPCWNRGGVLIGGPGSGLKHGGAIISDSAGGCIVVWNESEFGFPGAANIERARILRLSNSGERLWDVVVDSSTTRYSMYYSQVVRAGNRIYIPSQNGTRTYGLDGSPISNRLLGPSNILVTDHDGTLFNVVTGSSSAVYQKLTPFIDTIWSISKTGVAGSATILYNPLVPDGFGGTYRFRTTVSSSRIISVKVWRIDGSGICWPDECVIDSTNLPTCGVDGSGGFLIGDDQGRFWRFDSLRYPLWQNPVIAIQDPQNMYFSVLASDYHGGMIVAYWSTRGYIFAQHSGRNGHVGIITSASSPAGSMNAGEFRLFQNYPNPFNPSTTLSYAVPVRTQVTVKIINLLGQEVETLVNREENAGTHSVVWNAGGIASGMYFCRLRANGVMLTRKLLLVR
jgi:hypothetical protein